ncbi:MAG TPA: recombinase family protein [Solirubrobacterales bacterium]|nr:recombinase family protein [Solirubrobacterales bacterium]
MRRFAWHGRLSTKDKQDPTISFPSQRNECAEKAEELGGRIVCDFTDQEAGRRSSRAPATRRSPTTSTAPAALAPRHVDSKGNTSGKWSKTTIRTMLENHVYTGRLYWNRLDFRAVKQGEGPLIRRDAEEWVEAERRHEALVSEENFERVQMEMKARSTGNGGNRRRRQQKRFYLLRGIVHCATGHNPLRMQGKSRKGNTYYACGYRRSYGDTAAEATGHGKWQYVREDSLLTLIDAFFATRVFGPNRLAHFHKQSSTLAAEQESDSGSERARAVRRLSEVDQRIEC